MRQRPYDQQISINLGKISLVDHIRVYLMEDLNWFVRSVDNEQALISVKLDIADKRSPKYENCEIKVRAKFGSLMINYKS